MSKRKVHFVSKLTADSGTGDVGSAKSSEGEAHAVVDGVRTARECLELIFAETIVVGHSAVKLCAEGQAGCEVVLQREPAGVDVAARGLNSEDASAGVAGKKVSEVESETGLVGKGLLQNRVEPVVGEAGTEPLGLVAGGKFRIEARGEGRDSARSGGFREVPLDAHVGITIPGGVRRAGCAVDGEIRDIEVEFDVMRKSVVHFEVCRVLAEVRKLRRLKTVELVVDFEVKGALVGDVGVVGIKRHLREQRRSGEHADHGEEKPRYSVHAVAVHYTRIQFACNIDVVLKAHG